MKSPKTTKWKNCKFCGKIFNGRDGAFGLCHTHTEAYYRIKERKPRAIKRLEQMIRLERIVKGEPILKLEVTGTHL
jgi:hypothetical protein